MTNLKVLIFQCCSVILLINLFCAPIFVSSANGSPTLIFSNASFNFGNNLSYKDDCTNKREPALHTSPWLNRIPN